MWIVISGYLSEGLRFEGPFENFDDAVDYAEEYVSDGSSWEIQQLTKEGDDNA